MSKTNKTAAKAAAAPAGGKKKGGNALHNVLTVVGIVLCVALIPVLIVNLTLIVKSFTSDDIPGFAGYKPFIVRTGSMHPYILTGDLVIVKEVDPDTLEVGDVIAFRQVNGETTTVITHRILDITIRSGEKYFITKGDFNDNEDAKLAHTSMVEGEYVTRIPKLGDFAYFMSQPVGMVVFIATPLILFIIYDVTRRRLYEKKERKLAEEAHANAAAMQAEIEALRSRTAGEGAQPGVVAPGIEERLAAMQAEMEQLRKQPPSDNGPKT